MEKIKESDKSFLSLGASVVTVTAIDIEWKY